MSKKYGKIKEEKRLQESIVARDITKTIMDYGVSQYQITKIIYLLSLELENRDMSDDILAIVKEVLEDNNDVKSEESKIIVR